MPRSAQDQGHDLLAPLPERTVHRTLDRKADQSLDQNHRSATSARYRLVVRGDGDLDRRGDLALYDVVSDSWERTDVSSRHPRVVDELRRRIEELALEAAPYQHATCLPEPADEKRLERLRAIGYLGEEADD